MKNYTRGVIAKIKIQFILKLDTIFFIVLLQVRASDICQNFQLIGLYKCPDILL